MLGTRVIQFLCGAVGPSAQTALYVKAGDRVISVEWLNGGPADVTSKFESTISVAGEIQQSSSDDYTGNHVFLLTVERSDGT